MFSGIETSSLADVPSVPALLAAAEMLQSAAPVISGSFLRLAILLCDSHFAQHPSTSAADAAYLRLKYVSASMEPASTHDLDRFASMLLAQIPESATPTELQQLVYFCYASHCIHGPISPQTLKQLQDLEGEFAKAKSPPQRLSQSLRWPSAPVAPAQNEITDLIEIARYAFMNGSYKTAYTAMNAAVARLKK